jgi:hypothetical protein
MTQKFYIGVVARDHALIAAKAGYCSFSHGKQATVDKLNIGDQFVFYAPKSGVMEGETVQAFVALGTVTGEQSVERMWADTKFSAWTKEAAFVPINEVPVKPMLDDLSFVSNPRYWGMAFRRSFFEITPEDFSKIHKAMQR